MPLALTRALTDSIRRTITRTGIILLALTLIFQTILIAALNTLIVTTTPPDTTPTTGLVFSQAGSPSSAISSPPSSSSLYKASRHQSISKHAIAPKRQPITRSLFLGVRGR